MDAIIPVKDRPEVDRCVQSLLRSPHINQIIICDGGSITPAGQQSIAALKYNPQVTVLQYPLARFNKSYLLNQGLLHSHANELLVSDADIIWQDATLAHLHQQLKNVPHHLYSVAQVSETHPETVALKRDRYTYRITQTPDSATLLIEPILAHTSLHRPGCGLLCAHRQTWLTLGGYKERFQGWGWEDQDLLIRAELLGLRLETLGQVFHLSHSDAQRNRFHAQAAPLQTRNRNLFACLRELAQGKLWGDLPLNGGCLSECDRVTILKSIHIQLPDSLQTWLKEIPHDCVADHALSWARDTFANTTSLVATFDPATSVESV